MGTLGDVLYADKSRSRVAESDWAGLVGAIATGDQMALHALYERTNGAVFTLVMRIMGNLESAEEAVLRVFHDIWRRAPRYDASGGSVLAWVMNQARSRAIEQLPATSPYQRIDWPLGDPLLRVAASLQLRLARRIAEDTGESPLFPVLRQWKEPEWEEAAPGLTFKLLANDAAQSRASMLVRLAPGAAYPPHTHAGVEELHLLDGELWIDERKLFPGDYNRAEPGTADKRVWSETGCACVLIASTSDILS